MLPDRSVATCGMVSRSHDRDASGTLGEPASLNPTSKPAALDWLEGLGWEIAHGPDIGPGGPAAEREHYGVIVLERRLREALARLNPELPTTAPR